MLPLRPIVVDSEMQTDAIFSTPVPVALPVNVITSAPMLFPTASFSKSAAPYDPEGWKQATVALQVKAGTRVEGLGLGLGLRHLHNTSPCLQKYCSVFINAHQCSSMLINVLGTSRCISKQLISIPNRLCLVMPDSVTVNFEMLTRVS